MPSQPKSLQGCCALCRVPPTAQALPPTLASSRSCLASSTESLLLPVPPPAPPLLLLLLAQVRSRRGLQLSCPVAFVLLPAGRCVPPRVHGARSWGGGLSARLATRWPPAT